MEDSSDDFFNTFDSSVLKTVRPPPPPPNPFNPIVTSFRTVSTSTPSTGSTDTTHATPSSSILPESAPTKVIPVTATKRVPRAPVVRKVRPITTTTLLRSQQQQQHSPLAAATTVAVPPTITNTTETVPANTITSYYPTYPASTINNTATPTVMNPYLLSTQQQKQTQSFTPAPTSNGLEGLMDGPMDTNNNHNYIHSNSSNNGNNRQPSYYGASQYGGSSHYMMGTSTTATTSATLSPTLSIMTPQIGFLPSTTSTSSLMMDTATSRDESFFFEDEAPLLEELGIHMDHIIAKTRAVVLPFKRFGGNMDMDATVIQDADLYGPLALALLLGGELLLSGKIQFGYIYGFGLFGCISMTIILNLMTQQSTAISMWTVTSILGYALLPVNLLAAIKLLLLPMVSLTPVARGLGITTVLWSTLAATRLLEQGCGMRDQRYLVAYPIALLYSAFVMITIF